MHIENSSFFLFLEGLNNFIFLDLLAGKIIWKLRTDIIKQYNLRAIISEINGYIVISR